MRPPVFLAVLVLLAPALAGCLGAGQQTLVAPADAFANLAADGAEVVRTADAVTFAWEGALQPSVESGFIGPLGFRDARAHRFQVGPGVGRIVAEASGAPTVLLLELRDESGAPACYQGGLGGAACTLPAPPGLTEPVRWEAWVYAREDPDVPFPYIVDAHGAVPFRLEVTLHRGAAAPLGDAEAGTDPALRFGLAEVAPGGEPTLGATSTGALFVVAGVQVFRSRDSGATWEDVTPPVNNEVSFDPFLYVDPRTDRVLLTHLNIACSLLSWTDDEGDSWTTATAGCTDPLQDHQKVAVGDHPGPLAPAYDGTIYYSESKIWATVAEVNRTAIVVSRSLDGGLTWTPSVAHLGENEHRGQGNLLADTAGNVYVTYPFRGPPGSDVGLAVSHDHGVTWRDVVSLPGVGPGSVAIDPDVALDAAGNVFMVTEGGDGQVWLASSTDHGDTWAAPVPISPRGLRSGPFTAAIAGAEGQVAVAYLASPDTDLAPNDAPPWARWFLYVTYVEEATAATPHLRTALATPASDPVQYGGICTRGIACPGGGEQRNLLDFIDATLLPDGRVAVSFTDGCLATCTRASDSRDSLTVVAVAEDAPWGRPMAPAPTRLPGASRAEA